MQKVPHGIVGFFQTKRDEKIGLVATEKILDSTLELAGKSIYAKGVADSKGLLTEKIEDLEVDLNLLLE